MFDRYLVAWGRDRVSGMPEYQTGISNNNASGAGAQIIVQQGARALTVHVSAWVANVQVEASNDGGTTWNNLGAAITAVGVYTVALGARLYRTTSASACTTIFGWST